MTTDEVFIKNEYDQVLAFCETHPVPDYMLNISKDWSQGVWKMYWSLLQSANYSFENKVVLDFRCKYGHLLPLFLARGASIAIGVDAEDSYVEAGRKLFPELYPNIKILKTEFGYLPIQPETIDFVLINEVISHVNPGYLDTVYMEVARVLKPGGVVLISDGNNIANQKCREELIPFYETWELGPDGEKTARDVVTESYLTRRMKIIKTHYPDLEPAKVDYVAKNTSGLFGDYLLHVINSYLETGELIQRPYYRGNCPVNPGSSGVVMERGFYPKQVISALESYGIQATQIQPVPPQDWKASGNWLKDISDFVAWRLSGRRSARLSELLEPDAWRGTSEGFMILGTRKAR
jgi:SAM-dependent methyltransferase